MFTVKTKSNRNPELYCSPIMIICPVLPQRGCVIDKADNEDTS